MLGLIATDAGIAQELLARWVREAADLSFNRITIDGDTSTNDTLLLVASGASGVKVDATRASAAASAVRAAIVEIAQVLAQAIVRDGEGATKFITVTVEKARSRVGSRGRSLCDCPFSPGQDRLFRLGPEPRPHSRRHRLRRDRRPGRRAASTCTWTTSTWPRRAAAILAIGRRTASG